MSRTHFLLAYLLVQVTKKTELQESINVKMWVPVFLFIIFWSSFPTLWHSPSVILCFYTTYFVACILILKHPPWTIVFLTGCTCIWSSFPTLWRSSRVNLCIYTTYSITCICILEQPPGISFSLPPASQSSMQFLNLNTGNVHVHVDTQAWSSFSGQFYGTTLP